MGRGPLAVRFLDWTLDEPQAGATGLVQAELENVGTAPWDGRISLAYHWLDDRGNPIVWDGERTPLPPVEPGERAVVRAKVRAPIPPGRYGFVLDLVAENRFWLSELGSAMTPATVEVGPRRGPGRAELPDWVEPAPDWERRVAEAHAEGFAVVAGAVEWPRRFGRRLPHALEPYRPGPGRVPGFAEPLLCPSVLDGIALERLPDVEGLPAFAAPVDEPWIYDGRIVLRAHPERRAAVTARPRSGRRFG